MIAKNAFGKYAHIFIPQISFSDQFISEISNGNANAELHYPPESTILWIQADTCFEVRK